MKISNNAMIAKGYRDSQAPVASFSAVTPPDGQEFDSPISQHGERAFLRSVYLGTVLVRLIIGAAIFFSGYLEFFAGDAVTYDTFGWELAKVWSGDAQYTQWVRSRVDTIGHNGMFYWVAGGYYLLGRSPFLLTVIQILIVSTIP